MTIENEIVARTAIKILVDGLAHDDAEKIAVEEIAREAKQQTRQEARARPRKPG